MKKKLVALVPVRKGSQRVKNKNFKIFYKKNLLIYKIQALKKIKGIDKIIINTDSDQAIKIAKKMNVDYQKREKYFASSKCSNSEFWSHVASQTNTDYILFTNCTSPLITQKTYNNFIKTFKKNINKYDSFNTVTEIKEYLYLKSKPINFLIGRTPNSQDLPDVVKLNFAINIISKELMVKRKTLVGKKPFLYKLNDVESVDINTKLEFKFAEFLFQNRIKN